MNNEYNINTCIITNNNTSNIFKKIKDYLTDININKNYYSCYKLGILFKKMGANKAFYSRYFYRSIYTKAENYKLSYIKLINIYKNDLAYCLHLLNILHKNNSKKFYYKILQIYNEHNLNPIFKFNHYMKKMNNFMHDPIIFIKMNIEIIKYYANLYENNHELFNHKCNYYISNSITYIKKILENDDIILGNKLLDLIGNVYGILYQKTQDIKIIDKYKKLLKIGEYYNNYTSILYLGVINYNSGKYIDSYEYFKHVKHNIDKLNYNLRWKLYLYISEYKLLFNKNNCGKYIDLALFYTNDKYKIIFELSSVLKLKHDAIQFMADIEINCPIMFQKYRHSFKLICGHIFSSEIYSWLNKNTNCPLCRINLKY